MGIDHDGMAKRAGAMIARWGKPAQLLRGGTLRPCVAAVLDYNPRARGLGLEGAERALIAAPLAIPPDFEQDKFVKNSKLYQIPTPVKGPRPGDVAVFYDADIVYEKPYP
jgi:hypothetical protein